VTVTAVDSQPSCQYLPVCVYSPIGSICYVWVWTDDAPSQSRKGRRFPARIRFKTKPQGIAMEQIRAALKGGVAPGVVADGLRVTATTASCARTPGLGAQ